MDSESELISLISQLISLDDSTDLNGFDPGSWLKLITQIISLLRSIDFDSPPKPDSSELISLITQLVNSIDSDPELLRSLIAETLSLEPEPVLVSLIYRIFSVVVSMYSNSGRLVSLCPQAQVYQEEGKFHVIGEVPLMMSRNNKWECLPDSWKKLRLTDDVTHFHCTNCNGENHGEYKKVLVEIKHSLHQKHSLQLVWFNEAMITRECYCCDEYLREFFYYCFVCDYAMNVACVEKPQVLSIDNHKWHEHTLALFPRKSCLTCDVCALSDSSCPFFICPPCDFVVHQRCISLPRVIRISRHLHRISFTFSFDHQGDWFCSVCRRKIENEYGGYSCIKDDCCYAAHSRCATQSNVWDGIDLEGVPEEVEEDDVEPFVTLSDGIIQHFSHQHHHLKLDEDTSRDYDENKMCQGCVMPIYFGNFYSCTQCDFILHETCANLSRKIHHPVHPHMLTLVVGHGGVTEGQHICLTCTRLCVAGFFYECGKKECYFKLHVQCATVSEPLVHESHMHPLFLTSKPGEYRQCCVCKLYSSTHTRETFNCIECDFALCFNCATLPHKVRYKHDKHMLSLSYGEETASTLTYWCELCEKRLNINERFYKCD
ncbi:unnamed protein product [Thlaspi arvense]|uniref:Zinc finger PHD-type domain-containing protein n=1 Tax=Thlaspi arvense TaxID=13288 RepID=A0AAU9RYI1_THLAR|nr:unnamed protein product [Thlaspi arvense]